MKDVLLKDTWVDVTKKSVKALTESYNNYKSTVNALEQNYKNESKKLNNHYKQEALKAFDQSKRRITRDFTERNKQIRATLQADLGKATKLQPLLKSEMDFLDSMRYLKPEPEELQQLAQEKMESGADSFVRALQTVANENGITLLNVPPRPSEVLKRFDRLMGAADRIVNKTAPEDTPFAEVDFQALADDFAEFASERDRSGNYKQIRAVPTPTSLEEMIATDLQQEMEKAKNE